MGKNRKLRNGVDNVQPCSDIESENPNQEIPLDFLTSDDFCIVQKKRGNKKFSENQFSNLSRSLSNLKRNGSDEEGGKCHSDFWTCKFNGTTNITSNTTESNLCSPDIGSQIPSLSSDINPVDVELNDNIQESNTNIAAVVNEELSPESTEECSDSIPIKNVVLEIKPSFEKNEVTESNVGCSKKKNKKKDKKNPVDLEVEELLKKLELEEKCEKKSKTVIFTSSVCSKQDSLNLKCTENSNILNNSMGLGTSETESAGLRAKNESFNSERSANVSVTENTNHNQALKADVNCTITERETKPIQKRKEKKAKTKSNISENANLKDSSSHEMNSTVVSNIQENINNNDTLNTFKDENSSKSKNSNESEKRNKKRPGKKQLAIIHEALRKAKEEEERQRKEEEAKQKMAEEAEKMRLEKLRLEQERKERKKLKEKQRKEKMRAEGRLLSKSQKQSRARMVATLAALKQQGFEVPEISEKKPLSSHGPRLGNCKNFHRKRLDSCQSTQSSDSAIVLSERQKSESFSSQESSGKDSLSDLPGSFESIDDSTLIVDLDKGNFSYSEESDGLDDLSCDISKTKKRTDAKFLEKQKHNKSVTVSCNQVQLKESCQNMKSVKYRSPVVCVLGHVDTGKTKLLDYIRKTHVQDSEAGGITQQIGATMIPKDALKEKCKMAESFSSFDLKIPGLLVIDTPGHESFSNLRSRGSSICDIAVLVVDIMHGLEPQTLESINLLKKGKTPFVVALNKVDRLYGWKSAKDEDIENVIQQQSQATQMEFKRRFQEIVLQFANQCLNVALFYENKDPRSYVSVIPTSAITGDGMGNLLSTVTQLTQSLMNKKLIYSDKLEATVLEVKAIPGLGTTIDVILVNGHLQEGDTIVLAGQDGPIVTQIRSLLMPQPLKELRVKNPYIEYKAIEGAQGVKVTGRDLDKSIAGLPLLVAPNHSMIDSLKDEVNLLFKDTISSIKTSERGVYVQASTLGSLEALLEFLSSSGVPYFNVKIGPVVKKDVMKASIMLEHDVMYAAILAFDVKIERDAQELADSLGVHIFHADVIYHLFDMYIKYRDNLLLKQEEEIRRLAVYPCKLKILPEYVFNLKDPIVLGVHVEQGFLREGTPLCVSSRDILEIGTVSCIELNNNKVNCAKKGEEVCIKIDPKPGESSKTYGKHFDHEDLLVSRITRQSIDVIKEHFRNELQSTDWHLIVELKKMLHIV